MNFDEKLLEEMLTSINSFYNFPQIKHLKTIFSVTVANILSLLKIIILFLKKIKETPEKGILLKKKKKITSKWLKNYHLPSSLRKSYE